MTCRCGSAPALGRAAWLVPARTSAFWPSLPTLRGLGQEIKPAAPLPAGFVPPTLPTLPTGLALGTPLTPAETAALVAVAQAWQIATGLEPAGAGAAQFETFLGDHYPAIVTAVYRAEGSPWPPPAAAGGPGASAPAPAVTPEQSWATFDHPAEPGPWGLDVNGRWRKVKLAPGGRMDGNDYVPPPRPGDPADPPAADVRFTDAQRKAANAATLRADWTALIFGIAPRGATSPDGVTPGWGTLDKDIDYDYEGGALYPDMAAAPASAEAWSTYGRQATALYDWWRHPPWPSVGPVESHSLAWYRVYVDADGYRAYKPWTASEASSWFDNFELGRHDWECKASETAKNAADVARVQAVRLTEAPASYVGHMANIYPLAQCDESSSVTRRKLLRKAAIVGAIVAGAIFFGPAIAGFVKTAGAKVGGALLKAGKTVSTALMRVGAAPAPASTQQTVTACAQDDYACMQRQADETQLEQLLTKVVGAVNAQSTIAAIHSGAVPPPPATLSGPDFQQWATSIAMLALGKQATPADQAQLAAQIAAIQANAGQHVAASGAPVYGAPAPELDPAIAHAQAANAATQAKQSDMAKTVLIGGGLLLLLKGGM